MEENFKLKPVCSKDCDKVLFYVSVRKQSLVLALLFEVHLPVFLNKLV